MLRAWKGCTFVKMNTIPRNSETGRSIHTCHVNPKKENRSKLEENLAK